MKQEIKFNPLLELGLRVGCPFRIEGNKIYIDLQIEEKLNRK